MGPGTLQGDANSLVVGFFFNQLSGGTLTLMSERVVLNLAMLLWEGGSFIQHLHRIRPNLKLLAG
jgi:hypothetical protein